MKMKSIYLIFAISSILFNSCAVLINSDQTKLRVFTDRSSLLIANSDTLKNKGSVFDLSIKRTKKALELITINDSLSYIYQIKSQRSPAYYLNYAIFPYGIISAAIDHGSNQSYTYPKNLYLSSNSISYTTKIPDSISKIYFPRFLFKANPLKIIDLSNPSVELGIEIKNSHQLSTQLMTSYLTKFVPNNDFINYKGHKISLEEKYYTNNTALEGKYFSFEIDYLSVKYDIQRSFEDENEYVSKTLNIKKNFVSLNLKIGYQQKINKIYLDYYFGVGLRIKNVSNIGEPVNNLKMISPRHPNFYYIKDELGRYLKLNIPINIKIAF